MVTESVAEQQQQQQKKTELNSTEEEAKAVGQTERPHFRRSTTDFALVRAAEVFEEM